MIFGNIGIITICSVWENDTKTRLQETRTKSRMNPMVGQIVHIKEGAPKSKWRMGKIGNDCKCTASKWKYN